jgi:hypothetical protein
MSNNNNDDSPNKQLIKLITPSSTSNSNNRVYPFIDDLVDSLFNSNLNNLINKNTEMNSDKSVFMMFVNIYFMAYLHTQSLTHSENSGNIITENEKKQLLKQMLSEVIRCPEKRQVCVSLIKQINPLFNIDSMLENGDENDSNHFLKN